MFSWHHFMVTGAHQVVNCSGHASYAAGLPHQQFDMQRVKWRLPRQATRVSERANNLITVSMCSKWKQQLLQQTKTNALKNCLNFSITILPYTVTLFLHSSMEWRTPSRHAGSNGSGLPECHVRSTRNSSVDKTGERYHLKHAITVKL